jgi:hypothetical protein
MEEDPDWGEGNIMMTLTLHNLAKEYGLLPSEALGRASTFDLYVLDLSAKYSKHQQDVQNGNAAQKNFSYSQDQLQSMIDGVRTKEQP